MTHYACGECNGVSETEGVCQTEGCASNGARLMACDCNNPSHGQMSDEGESTEGETPTM